MSNLSEMLEQQSAKGELAAAAAKAVAALAGAAVSIADVIRTPDLAADLGTIRGTANADGDDQKALDVIADDMIHRALSEIGDVAAYLSEEQDNALPIHEGGTVIVASDPLDGSSNIDTNVSIGTIFSILPASGGLLQPGTQQLAAGFIVYGPQTTLLVSFGQSVMAYQLGKDGQFHDMGWDVSIPATTTEFAINASNQRYWYDDVSAYIANCCAGADGPRKVNFNMRWVGSLVADGWRIFRRGGIFLYPADRRKGYETGRLRLVYEANPVAFLVEAAGGKATDGRDRILEFVPETLHARIPLVFGSAKEVDEFTRYGS